MRLQKLVLLFGSLAAAVGIGLVRADSGRRSVSATSSRGEVRTWEVTGPWGGDVRSLVAAPDNADVLYLGTSDGQIFKSEDGAGTWNRLKPGIGRSGVSVDCIAIDPRDNRVMYAGTWGVAVGTDGGAYKSTDGGQTWKFIQATKGLSVRALTIAASDSNIIVAGSAGDDKKFNGAFRSTDAGNTWQRITPEGDPEIHNIESVAISPTDPNIIYVGTFHLPWKTTDAGATWKQTGYKASGMIDDSDIFGITIDPAQPDRIYINACSGIYRSETGGGKWQKLPGIPFSARRTYALLTHPSKSGVIFAGTSEGLWRSTDGGRQWKLRTSERETIRAVVVPPSRPDTVLIATDGDGIQISTDLGDDFAPANTGFIHRHILAILPDTSEHGRVLASVYHDGFSGSVYASSDDGESWRLSSTGLGSRDVYSFFQTQGAIYAGTNTGVYKSTDHGDTWSYAGMATPAKPAVKPAPRRHHSRRSHRAAAAVEPGFVSKYTSRPAVDTTNKNSSSKNRSHKATSRRKSKSTSAKPSKSSAKDSPSTKSSATGAAARSHATGRIDRDAKRSSSKAVHSKTAGPQISGKSPAKTQPAAAAPAGPPGPPLIALADEVDDLAGYQDDQGRLVLYAATMDGLYRTTDETLGWEKIAIGDLDPAGRVLSVSVNRSAPDLVFAGTTRGLYMSHDRGATWDHVDRGPSDMSIKSIAQDPTDPDLVIVATNQYLYRSSNGGRSWVLRGGGISAGDYSCVTFNPANPNEVMVSDYSRGGVFRSSDKGYNWDRIDSGLPSNRIWTLTFDPFEPDKLFAGSFSSGVYVLTIQHISAAR